MTLKRLIAGLASLGLPLVLVAVLPQTITRAGASAVSAGLAPSTGSLGDCSPVGGVLMTNIAVIDGKTNLGPVFGDLAGSVAAEPLTGAVGYHHNWVTASGDTIYFKDALLKADPSDFLVNGTVVAIRWGHYRSEIAGGTGKFLGATGYLDYFGLADFNDVDPDTKQPGKTLVLRYRGQVCYAQ